MRAMIEKPVAADGPTASTTATLPQLVYVPIDITYQAQSAFADLGIEDSVAEESAVASSRPLPKPRRNKTTPWLLIGSLLASAVISAIAGVVIIKITNKDGSVTEIKVPDGAKIEVDGKPVGPGMKKAEPWQPAAPWAGIPLGESPFDPKEIPKEERFDWQPKELVGVIGSHARRHWGAVKSVAFSPDGKKAATVGGDEIIVWDVATQKPVRRMQAVANVHTINILQFAETADRLHEFRDALEVQDTIRLWDLAADPPKELPLPAPPKIMGVHRSVLEAGKTLYQFGMDEVGQWGIQLFSISPNGYAAGDRVKIKPTLLPPAVVVQANVVVFINPEGKIHRAKVKNAKFVEDAELAIPLDANGFLHVLTPDGNKLAIRTDKQVQVWDLAQNPPKRVQRLLENQFHPHCLVALSPDGKWLTTAHGTTELFRIDGAEPKLVANLDSTGNGVYYAVFSPDSTKVIIGSTCGLVRFWELSGAEPKELSPFDPATAFSLPRSAQATSLDAKQGRLMLPRFDQQAGKYTRHQLWDFAGSKPTPLAFLDSEVHGPIHTLGQDRWVQIAPANGQVSRLYRQKSAGFEQIGEPFGNPNTLGNVSPDGRTLVVYSPTDKPTQLEGWDLTTDTPKRKWSVTIKDSLVVAGGWQVWFSADNRWFATQAKGEKDDGPWKLVLWRNTGAKPEVYATLPIAIRSQDYYAALSPDGRYLAHTPNGNVVVLLDLTGKEPREVASFTDAAKFGFVQYLAFHPDSKKLAFASWHGIGILDVATFKPIWDWQSPGPVHWLDWAADGRHLVTNNSNLTVYVLRMADSIVGKAPLAGDADRKAAEYVLSIGGTVRVNGEEKDIKAVAELPKEAFRLSLGTCRNNQATDAGLVVFKDCKNLIGLDLLGSTQVSDAGLAHFKACKKLTTLNSDSTKLTDAGLANFKDRNNWTHLSLRSTEITDAGLTNFKDCKGLTILALDNTKITGQGLAYFKDCVGLTFLSLEGTIRGDASLAHFRDCKNLTQLNIAETQVTDAGLANLARLEKLLDLNLTKTKVTADGVAKLAKALPKCKIVWDGGVIEAK